MPTFTDEAVEAHGLTLRALGPDDVPPIARACRDALLQRWLPLPRPYTEDDARFFALDLAPRSLAQGAGIERGIELDGELVGVIGLKSTDWAARTTEAGYWLAPWGRGRGVMTRALCALTDWALDRQGMGRVEVRIAPGNHASLAVARRALFTEEGRLRRAGVTHDGPIDLIVLSRLSDDPRPEVAVGGTSAPTSVKHP